MFLGSRGRLVRTADNFTAICDPTVGTIFDPQYLTSLRASAACYGDSFTFLLRRESCKFPFTNKINKTWLICLPKSVMRSMAESIAQVPAVSLAHTSSFQIPVPTLLFFTCSCGWNFAWSQVVRRISKQTNRRTTTLSHNILHSATPCHPTFPTSQRTSWQWLGTNVCSRNALLTQWSLRDCSCNCQYNCHEASILGQT
jgi:hypothetical protein